MNIKSLFLFFILLSPIAHALDPGEDVRCCWYLTDAEHGNAHSYACESLQKREIELTPKKCGPILEDWEKAVKEWVTH